jgi:hypothetical protein
VDAALPAVGHPVRQRSERDVVVRSDHLRDEFGLTRAEAVPALEILAGQGLQVAAGSR